MVRIDRIGEFDRDFDQREADEQPEHRKQEFELAHCATPPRLALAGWVRIPKQKKEGGSRRPGTKSLWLLPSGSDQVGDSAVRRLPNGHMGKERSRCKFMFPRTLPSAGVQ